MSRETEIKMIKEWLQEGLNVTEVGKRLGLNHYNTELLLNSYELLGYLKHHRSQINKRTMQVMKNK